MKMKRYLAAVLFGFAAVSCAGPEYDVEGTLTVRETSEICDFTHGSNSLARTGADGELREFNVNVHCYLQVLPRTWGERTSPFEPELSMSATFRELSTRLGPRGEWQSLNTEARGGIGIQGLSSPPRGCGRDYNGYRDTDASFLIDGPPSGEPFDEMTIRIDHPCAFGELLVFRTD